MNSPQFDIVKNQTDYDISPELKIRDKSKKFIVLLLYNYRLWYLLPSEFLGVYKSDINEYQSPIVLLHDILG